MKRLLFDGKCFKYVLKDVFRTDLLPPCDRTETEMLLQNQPELSQCLYEYRGLNATVKPRKQEHSKIRTCRLISWKKTPKDKNQKQTDLLQCSYEMVHLVKKIHHISVNKVPTIDN